MNEMGSGHLLKARPSRWRAKPANLDCGMLRVEPGRGVQETNLRARRHRPRIQNGMINFHCGTASMLFGTGWPERGTTWEWTTERSRIMRHGNVVVTRDHNIKTKSEQSVPRWQSCKRVSVHCARSVRWTRFQPKDFAALALCFFSLWARSSGGRAMPF